MPPLELIGTRLPAMARAAIVAWAHGRELDAPELGGLCAAVFVTLRRGDGSLRGSLGSLVPRAPDLVAETMTVAVRAASEDPRFLPLSPGEVEELCVSVSVVVGEEPLADPLSLDPATDGVVVRDAQGRTGVLLPGIAGIRDAATLIALARNKGGIGSNAEIRMSRLVVKRFSEETDISRK